MIPCAAHSTGEVRLWHPGCGPTGRHFSYHCSKACYWRQLRARRRTERDKVACAACGEMFVPKRADARYCSHACRQSAYRKRHEHAA